MCRSPTSTPMRWAVASPTSLPDVTTEAASVKPSLIDRFWVTSGPVLLVPRALRRGGPARGGAGPAPPRLADGQVLQLIGVGGYDHAQHHGSHGRPDDPFLHSGTPLVQWVLRALSAVEADGGSGEQLGLLLLVGPV